MERRQPTKHARWLFVFLLAGGSILLWGRVVAGDLRSMQFLVVGSSKSVLAIERNFAGTPFESRDAFYVWQRNWSIPVCEAVRRAGPDAGEFMVLAGEVGFDGTRLRADRPHIDWDALLDAGSPVVLVIRCEVSLSRGLVRGQTGNAAQLLAGLAREHVRAARSCGVIVSGVQVDYDCPTSQLGRYAELLQSLRSQPPGMVVSITALPTWLKNRDFSSVAQQASYFVLQVHSLEKPRTLQDAIILCDTGKLAGYLRDASSVGVPYYLSLPTYGYRVAFDEAGSFAALSAEGPIPGWKPGWNVRVAMADPVEMARVVRHVRRRLPAHCLGIVWFRLPVDTDELNWSWPALKAVIQGREPEVAFRAEVRNPGADLYELWLRNTGEANVFGTVSFDVRCEDGATRAYDILGAFREDEPVSPGRMRISGPAPRLASPVMAAWYRLAPGEPGDGERVVAGDVEVAR